MNRKSLIGLSVLLAVLVLYGTGMLLYASIYGEIQGKSGWFSRADDPQRFWYFVTQDFIGTIALALFLYKIWPSPQK